MPKWLKKPIFHGEQLFARGILFIDADNMLRMGNERPFVPGIKTDRTLLDTINAAGAVSLDILKLLFIDTQPFSVPASIAPDSEQYRNMRRAFKAINAERAAIIESASRLMINVVHCQRVRPDIRQPRKDDVDRQIVEFMMQMHANCRDEAVFILASEDRDFRNTVNELASCGRKIIRLLPTGSTHFDAEEENSEGCAYVDNLALRHRALFLLLSQYAPSNKTEQIAQLSITYPHLHGWREACRVLLQRLNEKNGRFTSDRDLEDWLYRIWDEARLFSRFLMGYEHKAIVPYLIGYEIVKISK